MLTGYMRAGIFNHFPYRYISVYQVAKGDRTYCTTLASINPQDHMRIPWAVYYAVHIQHMTATSFRCQTHEPGSTERLFYATHDYFPITVQACFC